MAIKAPEVRDARAQIAVRGARVHNLKNIDVDIPHGKFTVLTGLSGSGKSSLAFDTIYAEGQRRYVESLSSYARQFLGRLDKPEVESIQGISPAVAIEQKVISRNPRSTVGTTTEIYDYLKVLYARVGRTFSPETGLEVKRHTVSDVVDFVKSLGPNRRVIVKCPLQLHGRKLSTQLDVLQQQGFSRIMVQGQIQRLNEDLDPSWAHKPEALELVIDRLKADLRDEENLTRLADSVQTAFFEGSGICRIRDYDQGEEREFSNRFEADGRKFEEPSLHFFSFNNPYGACPQCEGFGQVMGIDENLVIPDTSLSVYEGAVVAWRGEKMQAWQNQVIRGAEKVDFPIHKPIYKLSEEQYRMLWEGCSAFEGIQQFFKSLEANSYKIQYRVMLSRYRGKTRCPSCQGTRLRPETQYVKVGGRSIGELVDTPLDELLEHFENLELNEHDRKISKRLLLEITNRLQYLCEVGLEYLSLNRVGSSLSGGESQRINLATSLGSALVGSTYILDEPSIGLHPRDTHRLIGVIRNLRDLGNTVIVVEHDEEIIRAADHIIDIGPDAGVNGGKVTFSGSLEELLAQGKTYTARYLQGEENIAVPSQRKEPRQFIEVLGAREHNLKNIDAHFPLHALSVVTGPSGSGKSTLINAVLYPALKKRLGGHSHQTGQHSTLAGEWKRIHDVEFVDQNPIGKSSRSNPVTYVKAYDEIRNLFAQQPLARNRRYKAGFFSFNIDGGRCEKCQGEGEVTIEMQFMADVHLTCDECEGSRFKSEVLEVKVAEHNIHDILQLTVDEALHFFEKLGEKRIADRLRPLQDVGLGYITLGQSSSTLSGGEAQRVKLATFLGHGQDQHPHLFIFDEPTTGLHFHDVNKLLESFYALLRKGHTIIVIEHHPDVIKCADWVVDLGPEGGKKGGHLVFQGSPEDLARSSESPTAPFLAPKLS